LIVPHANFRPNPSRAIYIQGSIDQNMVDRLTPKIIALQAANRNPITLYIDSRGGNVSSTELILRLLTASDQNAAAPCRIITVVTNRASSAAADLLSSGDYAIAFSESTVFYHGVRQSLVDPLTVEFGSALTESLKISNDQSAMALARKSEGRFMFRFVMMKHRFEEVRQKLPPTSRSDLDCFIALISEKLSARALNVVTRAQERHGRYSSLLNKAVAEAFKSKTVSASQSAAQVEAAIIKKIIDFEVSSHKKDPNWSFHAGGLSRLNDDFFLVREYVSSAQSEHFKKICDRWGNFALTEKEQEELKGIADEEARTKARLEKVRPHFQPLWSFFVALCHALQEGENDLTALDAFWLGLIDEVIGSDVPSLRVISEFEPDPKPPDDNTPS
jgi:ATP-dependent protease ClpP protease subunit